MKTKQRMKSRSAREKKVTLKFFVNQAVQPMVEGKTKRYPLYVLITYDRKNTMMRCHYGTYYKDLGEIDKVHYPGLLAMEERIIRKTIAYEMAEKHDFDLRGIYRKYEPYSVGIHVLLERYLKDQLWNILLRLEPFEYAKALNFNDSEIGFDTLYKICKKIYKDFHALLPKGFEREVEIYQFFSKLYQDAFFQYTFPTVVEWLDQSMVEDYRRLLKDHQSSQPEVNKSIEFIERVVSRFIGKRECIVIIQL
jgi:hypothetical protein